MPPKENGLRWAGSLTNRPGVFGAPLTSPQRANTKAPPARAGGVFSFLVGCGRHCDPTEQSPGRSYDGGRSGPTGTKVYRMTAMPQTRRGLTAVTLTLSLIGTALLGGVFPTAAQAAPALTVTEVVGNLKIPWDLTWVGGVMLYDQRAGGIWSKQGSNSPQRVDLDLPPVYDESEAGMLGMVADPAAATNKFFYTCIAVAKANGDPKGVEVWKWRLDTPTTATKIKTLISGIPLVSGRHSGCRLRFRSAAALYVGTGDAAVGTNPQSLKLAGRQGVADPQRRVPSRPATRSTSGAARRDTSGPTDIATSRG